MDFLFGIGMVVIEEDLKEFLPSLYSITVKNKNHTLQKLTKILSEYFEELNRNLKEYAEISYHANKIEKINAKALLKFFYHISDRLTNILKLIDRDLYKSESFQTSINDCHSLLIKRTSLIKQKFIPLAEEELKAFYSPEFRNSLESELDRFLSKRNPKTSK